jgi:formyltetrahydrofolate synthetase
LVALRTADYVVTESGFGAELGFEKFCNIKCRASSIFPDCAVVVASIRAMKLNSGWFVFRPGDDVPSSLTSRNDSALVEGAKNLRKIIDIVHTFGVPAVVAVNRFPGDESGEVELALSLAKQSGADAAAVSEAYRKGGEGALELASEVIRVCNSAPGRFAYLYDTSLPIKAKIETIARKIYGAGRVVFSLEAEKQIDTYSRWGFDNTPVCIAKTQFSISHNPNWKRTPQRYEFPVREIRLASGARYVYALTGKVVTMPGMPPVPEAEFFDIDEYGNIVRTK